MDEPKSEILAGPLDNRDDKRQLMFEDEVTWIKIILPEPDVDKKREILGFEIKHNSRLRAFIIRI